LKNFKRQFLNYQYQIQKKQRIEIAQQKKKITKLEAKDQEIEKLKARFQAVENLLDKSLKS